MTPRIEVASATAAVVTDLGRSRGPGFGLPVNGALDQYSARVANILVANAETSPLIELTAFDFSFSATADSLIAVTGAEMLVQIDNVQRPMWEPIPVRAGELVALSAMTVGLRTYIAFFGGLDVPFLLGSAAPDTVIGFGVSLARGSSVILSRSVQAPINPYFGVSLFNFGIDKPYFDETVFVDVTDGPDIDQFAGTAERLFAKPFTVTPQSNHIGLRMLGELPVRTRSDELISRGVPVGAVEVPPGDELLVLHRGRGVTAGYPVLAVVTSTSLDALGQARPGQKVQFRQVDVHRASDNARAWRVRLDSLRERVANVYEAIAEGELAQHARALT